MKIRLRGVFFSTFTLPIFFAGCTSIAPESLKKPTQMTCIEMPLGMEAHETLGLLHIPWVYALTPGPYLSEREDLQGVYYRAPPSGITINRDKDSDGDDSAAKKTRTVYVDGGIWLPRDPMLPPHFYFYAGSRSEQPAAPFESINCANAVLLPGAKPGDANAFAFAAAGAAGGAAGGIAGRSIAKGSTMSYGQAAGVGLVGGAIAGLIVAKLNDMGRGQINNRPSLTDPLFLAGLREAAKKAVPVLMAKPVAETDK